MHELLVIAMQKYLKKMCERQQAISWKIFNNSWLDPKEQISINQNTTLVIPGNAFENITGKILAILLRTQYISCSYW